MRVGNPRERMPLSAKEESALKSQIWYNSIIQTQDITEAPPNVLFKMEEYMIYQSSKEPRRYHTQTTIRIYHTRTTRLKHNVCL